jgi:hypothetical protein
MNRNMKKTLTEEISRIHTIMGISEQKILNEQKPGSIGEKLFTKNVEKVAVEDVARLLEKGGIKASEEISVAFRSLLEKEVISAEERVFLSGVVRTLFPNVSKSISKNVELGLIERYGLSDAGIIFDKIENILKNPKLSTEKIHEKLSGVGEKQLGMEVSIEQVQIWRDTLKNAPKEIEPIKPKPEPIKPEPIKPEVKIEPEIQQGIENLAKESGEQVLSGNTPEIKIDIENPTSSGEKLLESHLQQLGANNEMQIQMLQLFRDMMNKFDNGGAAIEKITEANSKLVDGFVEAQRQNGKNFETIMGKSEPPTGGSGSSGGGTGGPTKRSGYLSSAWNIIRDFAGKSPILNKEILVKANLAMSIIQIIFVGADMIINNEKYKGLFNEGPKATVAIKALGLVADVYFAGPIYTALNTLYTVYDVTKFGWFSGSSDKESNETVSQEEAEDFVRNQDGIQKFLPKGPDGNPMSIADFEVTFAKGAKEGEMDVLLDGSQVATLIKDCSIKGKFKNVTTDCSVKVK